MDQQPPPPAAPPQLPKVDIPVVNEMYVPTPEVQVVRESAPQFVATSIVPVTMVSEQAPAVLAAPQSAPLPVVSDSEVDYVVRPEIRFPLAAKRAREHGTVLLAVIVDENGLVRQIRVHRSSGYQRLDEVALKALRALRVKPYTRNGMAMSVEIRVPVEFSLSNAV